nr:hypothetical protein [Tanacetum cinerariifolium]
MSVMYLNYVNLTSSCEEQPNERTPSPPTRKKSFSPPQTPSKSISSKSTHYTSSSSPTESSTPTHVAPPPKLRFVILIKLEPQELPLPQILPNYPYVQTMDNWSPGLFNPSPPLRVSRPPLDFPNPPHRFEPFPSTQPLFVNINSNTPLLHNNAPPLENIHHPPPNLKNHDFPNPPNILDFVHLNDMSHLHNMFDHLILITNHNPHLHIAELVLEAKELLMPLAGAEEGSFIMIPFKVSALNVDFDFKIDLIVFSLETVTKELEMTSEWSVVFLCDSFEVIDTSELSAEDFTNTGSFGPELEVEGYNEEIVHDFKHRLEMILKMLVNGVHTLDFEGLTPDMRRDLAERLRMLGGARRSMTWRQLILALGLHTVEEMVDAVFGAYWLGSERVIPDKGDLSDYWVEISFGMDFLKGAPFYTYIRDLVWRLYHKLISYSISGRGKAPKKSDAKLSGGHFIGRLAHHFGLVSDDGVRGLFVMTRELPLIDMGELVKLNICMEIGDDWDWVAQGAKRQSVVVTAAPRGAEDAPYVNEGARLDVRSLQGLMERSMTDHGIFSTWMVSCVTQLMEASERTYQAFDGTFRGSYPEILDRRTRRRTDGASTSVAPQQPDP